MSNDTNPNITGTEQEVSAVNRLVAALIDKGINHKSVSYSGKNGHGKIGICHPNGDKAFVINLSNNENEGLKVQVPYRGAQKDRPENYSRRENCTIYTVQGADDAEPVIKAVENSLNPMARAQQLRTQNRRGSADQNHR